MMEIAQLRFKGVVGAWRYKINIMAFGLVLYETTRLIRGNICG